MCENKINNMKNTYDGNEEKISVIVPVYNVEKYIEKSLESIVNQTYKNLEIILIDDGSPDSSGKICDEFAKKDERIKVIHKKNEGLSATRNCGLDVCTGEYVAFIDSDDWIADNYFEVLRDALIKHDADVAEGKVVQVVKKDVAITSVLNEKVEAPEGFLLFENEDIIKGLLIRKILKNNACGKLFRSTLIKEHRFPVGVNYEDIIFSYETLSDAKKAVFLNQDLYFYLRHEGSITSVCSEKNLNDFANAIIYRFNDVLEKHSNLTLYNYYGLLEQMTSISIKYVISDTYYEEVDKKLLGMIELLNEYSSKNEAEFLNQLSDFQKACLYLMKYNVELYYNFLRERQKMKVAGKIN